MPITDSVINGVHANNIFVPGNSVSPAESLTERLNSHLPYSNDFMSGYKNKIINGNFDIWQRGVSFVNPNGGYTADRWRSYVGNGAGTVSAVATSGTSLGNICGKPSKYFLRHYQSTASTVGQPYLSQRIEWVHILPEGKAVASFVAWASQNITVSVNLTQNFGTGGSPSTAVSCGTFNVDLTTTPTRYFVVFNVPSLSGKTLGSDYNDYIALTLYMPLSLTYYAYFGQVQLEEGSVATPFESRHIGQELALCQRYYETTYPLGTAPGTNMGSVYPHIRKVTQSTSLYHSLTWTYKITKRALPSVKWYSPDGTQNVIFALSLGNAPITPAYVATIHGAIVGVNGFSIPHDYELMGYATADAEL